MKPIVRLMTASEAECIIDYFHQSTPEHLEMLGVDPSRLPSPAAWRKRLDHEFALPIIERSSILVAWTIDDTVFGFSTADTIVHGERAHMHLHVIDRDRRSQGLGAACVRESVALYFSTLKLKRLFCEPNAFNVAPNRTLQKAGFKYLKTHMTVPGPINFHQAVTRWVFEP
jgi:RimJ/RimL family protein N-acetyltransferase